MEQGTNQEIEIFQPTYGSRSQTTVCGGNVTSSQSGFSLSDQSELIAAPGGCEYNCSHHLYFQIKTYSDLNYYRSQSDVDNCLALHNPRMCPFTMCFAKISLSPLDCDEKNIVDLDLICNMVIM